MTLITYPLDSGKCHRVVIQEVCVRSKLGCELDKNVSKTLHHARKERAKEQSEIVRYGFQQSVGLGTTLETSALHKLQQNHTLPIPCDQITLLPYTQR